MLGDELKMDVFSYGEFSKLILPLTFSFVWWLRFELVEMQLNFFLLISKWSGRRKKKKKKESRKA